MKKILNLLLLLSSLFGYLEWGTGQHAFLFQAEMDIFIKAQNDTESLMHPFVVLPLIGQLLLLFTLFQKTPSKKLTYTGLILLSTIMLMLLLVGSLSMNMKVLGSIIPFFAVAILIIKTYRKREGAAAGS